MKMKILAVLVVVVMLIFCGGLTAANWVPSAGGISQHCYYADDEPNAPAEPEDPNAPAVPE